MRFVYCADPDGAPVELVEMPSTEAQLLAAPGSASPEHPDVRGNGRSQGATVWITGLPASGKTTLGNALADLMSNLGVAVSRLDGDELRRGINRDLGFSAEDRAENVRRTAHVAQAVAKAGAIAIVTLVSPCLADREAARELHSATGLRFVEVFMDTPLEDCERRDPRGLYALARQGRIKDFTGVSAPYERPRNPDATIRIGQASDALSIVMLALENALSRHYRA
jgi:bifunctional enzyme CysN/CysC